MLLLGLACMMAGIGIGIGVRDGVRLVTARKPRCSWCDAMTPKPGLCADCLGHDREQMEGWQ